MNADGKDSVSDSRPFHGCLLEACHGTEVLGFDKYPGLSEFRHSQCGSVLCRVQALVCLCSSKIQPVDVQFRHPGQTVPAQAAVLFGCRTLLDMAYIFRVVGFRQDAVPGVQYRRNHRPFDRGGRPLRSRCLGGVYVYAPSPSEYRVWTGPLGRCPQIPGI